MAAPGVGEFSDEDVFGVPVELSDEDVFGAAPAQPKRQVGFVEGVKRFGAKALGEAGKRAGLALAAPAAGLDWAANLFRDEPKYPLGDMAFSGLVDPSQRNIDFNRLLSTEQLTPGGQTGAVVGSVAGMLPDLITGGGFLKAGPDLAMKAGVPTAEAIAKLLTAGVVSSQPITQTQALTTYDDLTAAGVDPGTARSAALDQYGVDSITMATPIGAAGGVAKRAISGGAAGVMGGVAADSAVNRTLGEAGYPDQQRDLTDPVARGTEGSIGAIMSMLLGSRAPRVQTRVPEMATPSAEQVIADALVPPSSTVREGINERAGVQPQPDQKQRQARRKDASSAFQSGGPVTRRDDVLATDTDLVPLREGEFARDRTGTAVETEELARLREVERLRSHGFDREAFDVAEAQRTRKQDAQDRSNILAEESGEPLDPRDLREARAGGTTTREGTVAIQPERFTFMDAKIKDGAMIQGEQVEVLEPGLFVPKEGGKGQAPASKVRLADGTELVVEDGRLSTRARPKNPRYAQDIAATTYRPPKGVGLGEPQPKPREAGQRITTQESNKVYVGAERRKGPQTVEPRQGRDVTDLALDRIGTRRPLAQIEPPHRQLADKATEERRRQMDAEFDAAMAPRRNDALEPNRPKGRNLLEEIRKWGGINSKLALDIGGEKGFRANSGNIGLFRKNGLGIDDLALYMQERGWITPGQFDDVDGGAQAARDLVDAAMRGDMPTHPDDLDAQARFEADRRAYNEVAQEVGLRRDDVLDLEAAERAKAKDPDAFEDAAMRFQDDDAGFDAAIRRILDDNQSTENRQGGEDSARAEERPEAQLRGETEAEIRAREQAADDSDARARDAAVAAENKARADRELDDFSLTGSYRPADANPNQKDILDGSGTLQGGFPLKPIVDAIAKAFGWLTKDAKSWSDEADGFWKAVRKVRESATDSRENPAVRIARAFFESSIGDLRGKLRHYNSPTANWVLEQFAAEAGGKGTTGRTFHDAVTMWTNTRLNRLGRVLGGIKGEKELEAIADLVRNPGRIVPSGGRSHVAAREIRKMLDEALVYMRESGVDVGEVRDGYFPREYDLTLVQRQQAPFKAAAAQAYRELGLDSKQAAEAAEQLLNSLLFGDGNTIFKPERGQPAAPFLKGRVFGKQVDNTNHPLHRFLVSDPSIAIPQYLQRVSRRAETTRRFGNNFEKWADMKRKMIDEGAGEAIDDVENFVAVAAGMRNPNVSQTAIKVAGFARMWGALMMLEKATLSSLSEFVTPAIRAGNGGDVVRSLKTVVQDLIRKGDAKRLREFGEDMGLLAGQYMDTFNSARFAGGEPIGALQTQVMDAFFKRTGLTRWTEATRVGSIGVGQVFIRRLAKDMQGKKGKLTQRYLAELGVPEAQAKAFADYVLSKNNGNLTAADVTGPMGELYRTAIQRFLNQSIMSPEVITRPRWASSPLGSVIAQLQSFNYAFYENVLKRNAKLAKDAALNKEGYTENERLRMLAPMMMLPLLVGVAAAVGEARDALLGSPERRAEETVADKAIKAFSRGAPIAPLDPWLNLITGARYNSTAIERLAGPVLGKTGDAADALMRYAFNDNSKTNAAERQLSKQFYDMVIEPTTNLILPGIPMMPLAAKAAATQVVGSGDVREAFITATAGGKKKQQNQRPKHQSMNPM